MKDMCFTKPGHVSEKGGVAQLCKSHEFFLMRQTAQFCFEGVQGSAIESRAVKMKLFFRSCEYAFA